MKKTDPKCLPYQGLFSAFLDGEISTEDSAHLETHLNSCEQCDQDLRNMAAATKMIQDLPLELPPKSWEVEVIGALAAHQSDETQKLPFSSFWWKNKWVWAAASILLLSSWGGAYWLGTLWKSSTYGIEGSKKIVEIPTQGTNLEEKLRPSSTPEKAAPNSTQGRKDEALVLQIASLKTENKKLAERLNSQANEYEKILIKLKTTQSQFAERNDQFLKMEEQQNNLLVTVNNLKSQLESVQQKYDQAKLKAQELIVKWNTQIKEQQVKPNSLEEQLQPATPNSKTHLVSQASPVFFQRENDQVEIVLSGSLFDVVPLLLQTATDSSDHELQELALGTLENLLEEFVTNDSPSESPSNKENPPFLGGLKNRILKYTTGAPESFDHQGSSDGAHSISQRLTRVEKAWELFQSSKVLIGVEI